MKSKYFFFLTLLAFFSCEAPKKDQESDPKTDEKRTQDNNVVKADVESVKIGDQVWMMRNLNTATYRNGDPIEEVKEDSLWQTTSKGAWCFYDNDPENEEIYGRLYNWYAINDERGICPQGWRVPSEQDWEDLISYLGTEDSAGGFLKDTLYWEGKNAGANNETGFSAVPSGYRLTDGSFLNKGIIATYWTSEKGNGNNAWDRFLISKTPFVGRSQYAYENGFSCRCIKE